MYVMVVVYLSDKLKSMHSAVLFCVVFFVDMKHPFRICIKCSFLFKNALFIIWFYFKLNLLFIIWLWSQFGFILNEIHYLLYG